MFIRALLAIAALLLLPIAARAQSNPCASYENAGATVCGQDYSANAAAVPISGYVLVATVPAGLRNNVEIQNQSTDTIQVVRDDGSGNDVSSIMLAPAAATGQQGGGWWSATFRGRVRVYAPSSSDRVAAFTE